MNIEPTQASLNIVHVVSSLNVGGMEQFVVRMAAHQHAQGHCVSIVTPHDGPLREAATRQGVPVRLLRGRGKAVRMLHTAQIIRGLRPDIVHAHNTTSLHFAVLGKLASGSIGRANRAQVVLTCHGRGKGTPRTLCKWEKRGTDAVVTVSRAVAGEVCETFGAEKVSVILNGVGFAPSARTRLQIRQELGLGEQITGVTVARMDALKGHAFLLPALAQLRGAGLKLRWLFVGDGEERGALERQAAELGLMPMDIQFLGFRQDVPDLLAACDLFALPSLSEGLPLSVLEAMSHGLAVVATDVGGIPELVTPGAEGLLVPPRSAPCLADALARLTQNADLRRSLGAAGRQRVKTDFSFDRMAQQYECLYARLIQN